MNAMGRFRTGEITPHHQKRREFRGLFRPESAEESKECDQSGNSEKSRVFNVDVTEVKDGAIDGVFLFRRGVQLDAPKQPSSVRHKGSCKFLMARL
jgi:hypothetical protein